MPAHTKPAIKAGLMLLKEQERKVAVFLSILPSRYRLTDETAHAGYPNNSPANMQYAASSGSFNKRAAGFMIMAVSAEIPAYMRKLLRIIYGSNDGTTDSIHSEMPSFAPLRTITG